MKEVSKYIGGKIRELREDKRMTQKDLGELLNYSPMGISHFEKGIRDIRLTDLEKLSKYFLVPLSFFFPENNAPISLVSTSLLRSSGRDCDHAIQKSLDAFDLFLNDNNKG